MPHTTKPTLKVKLATLFSQLSFFQPERNESGQWTGRFLVNQSKVDEHKRKIGQIRDTSHLPPVSCPPDRDDLLHLIGEGSLELREFIQEHDELKAQTSGFVADGMLMRESIKECIGGLPDDMPTVEQVGVLVGRYRQMYDLIHSIAHDIPLEEVKGRAFRFLQWKNLQPLVTQNDASQNQRSKAQEATQNDARSGQPVCTCEGSVESLDCEIHGDKNEFPWVCPTCHRRGYDSLEHTCKPLSSNNESQG